MTLPRRIFTTRRDVQFDMTPLIDMVLLLIIFFMLACDFISRENYKLKVPDNCSQAKIADPSRSDALTLSVFPLPAENQALRSELLTGADAAPPPPHAPENPRVIYAVRSDRFDPQDPRYRDNPELLIDSMSGRIKAQPDYSTAASVVLRADRDVPYGRVQASLIALSRAGVQKVQLAVTRSPRKTPE